MKRRRFNQSLVTESTSRSKALAAAMKQYVRCVRETLGEGFHQRDLTLNGSRSVKLSRGRLRFLRPHQSEFVFLQFGAIAVYDGRHISENWPIFQQGA